MKSKSFLGGLGITEKIRHPEIVLDLTFRLSIIAENELIKNKVSSEERMYFLEEIDEAESYEEVLKVIKKWMSIR